MSFLKVMDGRIMFSTVHEAVKRGGNAIRANDPSCIIVWHDTIRTLDYFSGLKPWQIVNRLPNINVICRKAPFVKLLQRVDKLFHNSVGFLPRSWTLPNDKRILQEYLANKPTRIIIKPDNGSLGAGIQIVECGQKLPEVEKLSIVQEYVESLTINSTKFDMRIYVLIASVTPLSIYVYRDGIARFCSQKVGGTSPFSRITNTAVNKKNPEVTLEAITQMVRNVFADLKREGKDVDALWKKIDHAIIVTVLSAIKFLEDGERSQCPPIGYPRCFQILGFDVLVGEDMDPYILEVNYRPSLEAGTSDEADLKANMLRDAMRIAAPFDGAQELIDSKFNDGLEEKWPSIIGRIKSEAMDEWKTKAESGGNFKKAYPCDGEGMAEYQKIAAAVREMPAVLVGSSQLPMENHPAQKTPSQKTANESLRAIVKGRAQKAPKVGSEALPSLAQKVAKVQKVIAAAEKGTQLPLLQRGISGSQIIDVR